MAEHTYTERERDVREARKAGRFIGFLACSHGPGRVLKVALPDERRHINVRCPVAGCVEGEHATSDAMPRPRRRGEECDIAIEPDPPPGDPTPPADFSATRRTVSDAAIFAAVSTENAPAAEVAEAAGYVGHAAPDSLRKRLLRMNKRSEDCGEPPPFIVTPGAPGKSSLVRRSGKIEA